MFFIPTIIVFIVFKKQWIKTIAALTWFVGFLLNAPTWPLYLLATAIWYPIIAVVVWLIRRLIKKKRSDK